MTGAGGNFLLIPWQRDFLAATLDCALEQCGGDPGRAVFLFPNNRPEKYLARLLRTDTRIRRPLIMPRTLTVGSLFSELRMRLLARPAWNAGLLDRIGLLLHCVREESRENDLPGSQAFIDDAGLFFPWGMKLASLYEECFNHACRPENFIHAEGTASPFAASLLARLRSIFERYVAGLHEREWTTPGLDASLVAEYIQAKGSLPDQRIIAGFPETPLFIAGFHALTGTEDILFRYLWQDGAHVLIHGDPALEQSFYSRTSNGNTPPYTGRRIGITAPGGHWSCRVFKDWAKRWGTELQFYDPTAENRGKESLHQDSEPAIRYFQGFDLHSQLTVLEKELALSQSLVNSASGKKETAPQDAGSEKRLNKGATTEPLKDSAVDSLIREASMPGAVEDSAESLTHDISDTVVVLPDSGLLMPVLHHLPGTDINISMGYPLSRSPLFRLLDTLASLQENRKEHGYYWRDLLELIRHPYIKMLRPLEPTASQPDSAPLRRELHRLEQALREYGRRYIEPMSLLEQSYLMLEPEELPSRPILELLQKILSTCLSGFERAGSPRELGKALETLCGLLLEQGRHLWERFLIDAECLFRIMQSLIPELSNSALAGERFPSRTLFGMLRRLMQAERVPFEASPLVGLQVMGMLETRLLSFRRVIVLEVGEDSLPGSPSGDPLLPEALRPELGLPPLSSREQVSAYHFFRLIAGSETTLLLWQEGGDTPGIQEQKKIKSRFVEELLWREEKELGRLLSSKGKDGPLEILVSSVASVPRHHAGITVTAPVRGMLDSLLQTPVSASLLDDYLRCPLQFYYRHLARLAPSDEIVEGDDPLAVGNLFHQTLQESYAPFLGRQLPGGLELSGLIGRELEEGIFSSPDFARLAARLPADSATMLGCAAKKRLEDYLRLQPPSTVTALETKITIPFVCEERELSLTGKADRIDIRSFAADDGSAGKGLVILDYKTGRLPLLDRSIWEDGAFWERIANWQPDLHRRSPNNAEPLLEELAARMQSVQLPFYLLLVSRHTDNPENNELPAYDAAWVELARQGEEFFVFPPKFSTRQRREAVEKCCFLLVDFLLRNILKNPCLAPRPGAHCLWCSSEKLCIRTADH